MNQSWKQWSRDVPVDASANPAILAFDKVASRLWLISEQLYHLIHRDMGFELSHSAKKFAREWSPLTMEPVLLEKHMEQKSNWSVIKSVEQSRCAIYCSNVVDTMLIIWRA